MFIHLPVALREICDLVGGQISVKKWLMTETLLLLLLGIDVIGGGTVLMM
jgi:hypothetical protein